MKFKDIVNRDVVNLTNCEHEPIHIPGSIQPHGFLLGLKKADLVIDYCSGNCQDYTAYNHEQLLGKSFSQVFGEAETGKLINCFVCKYISATAIFISGVNSNSNSKISSLF